MQQMIIDIGFTKETASFGITAILLTTTPFSFLSPYLIERVGRRPLFLMMSLLCSLEWGLFGVGLWQAHTRIGASVGMIGLASGHLAYKLGVNSLPAIILNELCPFASKAAVSEVSKFRH
jgi:cyanate permease